MRSVTVMKRKESLARWLAVLAVTCVTPYLASASDAAHRVHASILSRESSLHTSLSNRDVYLLRVSPRQGPAFDAIAVDSYPGYATALPIGLLHPGAVVSIRLIRNPDCDRSAGANDADTLRCFTIEHGSWKLPKRSFFRRDVVEVANPRMPRIP
jgi:hypothetical protein